MISGRVGSALAGALMAAYWCGCVAPAPSPGDVCDFSSLVRYFESSDWSWSVIGKDGMPIASAPMSVSYLRPSRILILAYRRGACCVISEGREPHSIVVTDVQASRDPRYELSTCGTSNGHITNGVVTWSSVKPNSADDSLVAQPFRHPWILETSGVRMVDAARDRPFGSTVRYDVMYRRILRYHKGHASTSDKQNAARGVCVIEEAVWQDR